MSRSVSVERIVDASPEAVFEVLADPSQHPVIDGSGMVRASVPGAGRLSLGAEFGMSMRMGVPYSMVNEVVEYEAGRRIAWTPRMGGPALVRRLGRALNGPTWRYELEPVGSGTRVCETYDWSSANAGSRLYILAAGWPRRAERAMTATLTRLADHVRAKS